MSPEVRVKRTLLNSATIDDPTRKVYMIEYQTGELPPKFLYIPEKDWSKEKELKLIAEDVKKRAVSPGEIITI